MELGRDGIFQAESSHLFFQLVQVLPLSSSSCWGSLSGVNHDALHLSLAVARSAMILPGCALQALQRRGSSSHPMLPPLTRAPHEWERLCWGGGQVVGPDVMTPLPGCSAVLWLLSRLLEGNFPTKPQATFWIAKGAVQECEGGRRMQRKAIGWRKCNYLPFLC